MHFIGRRLPLLHRYDVAVPQLEFALHVGICPLTLGHVKRERRRPERLVLPGGGIEKDKFRRRHDVLPDIARHEGIVVGHLACQSGGGRLRLLRRLRLVSVEVCREDQPGRREQLEVARPAHGDAIGRHVVRLRHGGSQFPLEAEPPHPAREVSRTRGGQRLHIDMGRTYRALHLDAYRTAAAVEEGFKRVLKGGLALRHRTGKRDARYIQTPRLLWEHDILQNRSGAIGHDADAFQMRLDGLDGYLLRNKPLEVGLLGQHDIGQPHPDARIDAVGEQHGLLLIDTRTAGSDRNVQVAVGHTAARRLDGFLLLARLARSRRRTG